MDNKKVWLYTLNAIAFVLVLAYFGALSLMLPPKTYSEVERRDLTEKPVFSVQSFFDKQYTRQFDSFYADAFPVRDGFIKLSYEIDGLKGVESEVKFYQSNIQEEQKPISSSAASSASSSAASVASGSSADPASGSSTPASSQSATASSGESSSDPQTEAVDDNAYLNNNIFIYENAAYQLFFGNEDAAENFAKIVSTYAYELPGVRVFTQVVPQPFNFYLPQRYRKMGVDEKQYAAFLHSKLTHGAKGVQVYEKLEENKDQYLYFRTDTHWTARGAYCAYLAFCDQAGFTPVPLEKMEKRQVPGDFLGYLYTITMDKNLAKTPDYVEYFIVPGVQKVEAILDRNGQQTLTQLPSLWAEDRRGGNAYSTFIYGDLPYMRVQTGAGTGKSVLLIKDSYGNAFAPYLVSHYDTVHILDERYFPYSVYDLIEREGIDDVIISQSSYSANAGNHQNNLLNIRRGGKPLPDWDNPPDPASSTPPAASSTPADSKAEGEKPQSDAGKAESKSEASSESEASPKSEAQSSSAKEAS